MSVNPILLQKALKQNANDLHDFAKDLKSWGEDMKRKEESIKQEKQAPPATRKSPNVKKIKRPDKPKAPVTKIGSTDYAAWDKFDVDTELQKLEEDIQDDSDLTDECNDNMYDEAIVEKEKGNKLVKTQEWEEAIKCYTKAIECYSYDPVFYANRALCYLKLSKYEDAENDCNLSLKLDETYVKAYQRRAAARMQLNKLEHAEVDLQKVLLIEPNNKESKAELLKLSVVLKRDKEKHEQRPVSKFTASRSKQTTNITINSSLSSYNPLKEQTLAPENQIDDSKPIPIWPTNTEIIEVKPIQKPPHLRSQKPLKRIEIKEINGLGAESEKEVKNPPIEDKEPLKKHVLEHQKISVETPQPISAFKKQKADKIPKQTNIVSSIPNPENKLACLRTEDLKIIENLNPKDVKNTVNDSKKQTEINESNFAYPKNSVQFYSSWKNFTSTEDKYKYLKNIQPQDIPKLFLNSLDSSIFSSILEVMAKHFIENNDQIFDMLNFFTEVKRFGAIIMFMSSEDKSNVWKLLDYIKEKKEKEKEDVDRIIQKFEL